METNDIKNIWKAGVEKNIKPYSEEELNEMIVKSARKSIRAIYPGTIFRLVIIAVIVFLLVTLLSQKQATDKMLIDISALVVTSVSYFFLERSAYKMRKYTNGKPIKEWLEYRIKEIEKSTRFNTKYNFAIYACSLFFAIGFYFSYQIVTNTPLSVLTVIFIPIGIIIYLWFRKRSQNRHYQKTLRELKEMYKQFEDSNE